MNKLDSKYEENSLPSKSELIAQIDTNLKHLQGQKKILQSARDGKTWKHKYSLTENKYKKTVRNNVTNSYTQTRSSLNNLNMKKKYKDLQKSHIGQHVHLVSGNPSLNTELKIHKSRSSVNKLNYKTQNNELNKYFKRFLSEKHTFICFEKPPLESCSQSTSLESEPCQTFKFKKRSQLLENSYTSHTYRNIRNHGKAVKAKSIYTQNSKNSPEFIHSTQSQRNGNIVLKPRSPKINERTGSSIRRHEHLSKELLDYAKWRASQKNVKISKKRTNLRQNISLNHDTSNNADPDNGRKSNNKKEHIKYTDQVGRTKENILAETTWSSKSNNVNTIKSKVIDDSTYVCPDNSEENNYLLLPYDGNASKDDSNSLKTERDHSDKLNSVFAEITYESIVVSKEKLSKPSSKTSRCITNERKARAYESYHKPENINEESNLSKGTDNSKYMSHSLESTWESHAKREGPLSSKFETSHYHSFLIPTDSRLLYYNHPDQSVSSIKGNSKPLRSEQYQPKERLHNHNRTELAPKMDQEKYRTMPLKELSKNNKDSTWNLLLKQNINEGTPSFHAHTNKYQSVSEKLTLKKKMLHTNSKNTIDPETKKSIPCESEQLEESLELDFYRSSSEFDETTSDETPVKSSIVKQKEEFIQDFKTPPLLLLNDQTPELGSISQRSMSLKPSIETPTPTVKTELAFQQDTMKHTILKSDSSNLISESGSILDTNTSHQHKYLIRANKNHKTLQISKQNEAISTLKGCGLGATSSISANGRNLGHPPSLNVNASNYELSQKTARSESMISVSTAKLSSSKFEQHPTSQKNLSLNIPSVARESNSKCSIKGCGLGAIKKMSSNKKDLVYTQKYKIIPVSFTAQPGESTAHDNPREQLQREEKINISLTSHNTTSKCNQDVYLKSESNRDADVGVSPSFPLITSKTNTIDFDVKAKDQSSVSQKTREIEPIIYDYSGDEPEQFNSKQPLMNTPKPNQLDKHNKPRSDHIIGIEVLKSFRPTLNTSELGAIPKLKSNEQNLASKSLPNKSSLSLSVLPEIFRPQDFSQNLPHSYPGINNLTGQIPLNHNISSQRESERKSVTNNDTEAEASKSNRSSPYKIKEQYNTLNLNDTSIKKPDINKSSGSQYSEFISNKNVQIKNSFSTPAPKFKQISSFSKSAKSYLDLNNGPIKKILQTTSSIILNSNKLEASDISSLKTGIMNTKSTEQNFLKIEPNEVNQEASNSKMPLSFPKTEEELQSSLSLANTSIKGTQANVNSQKKVFLSDTFDKNIPVENVSPKDSDFIQYLLNRVKDCDENVKTQSKEITKLKENCKLLGSDGNGNEDEAKTPKDLTKSAINSNALLEPLFSEETSEADIEEENSCHCIFCGREQSGSDNSEEIPSFTGCDCMKEDYYKIMKIAYNK